MAKISDALHELIHKMDKSEKRMFRLFAQTAGKGRAHLNYLELFDLIEAQANYDEAQVIKALNNRSFASNLPVGKHYLFQFIMRFLRYHHAGENVQFRVREMWMDIFLLQRKGLHKQAHKLLDKAMKLSKTSKLAGTYLDLSRIKRRLVRNYKHRNLDEQLNELILESKSQYEQLGIQLNILDAFEKTYIGIRDRSLDDAEWEELMNEYRKNLEMAKDIGYSIEDISKYYAPLISYYRKKKRYPEAVEIFARVLHAIDSEENPKKQDAGDLISFLTNYLNACVYVQDIPRMKSILDRMKSIKHKLADQNMAGLVLYSQISTYYLAEEYHEVIALATELHTFLHDPKQSPPKSRKWAMCINTGASFMLAGDYDGAITWFNFIPKEPEPDTLVPPQFLAHICLLICHFELGHQELAEAMESRLAHYLRKRPEHFKVMLKPTFSAIRRYIHMPDKTEQRKSLHTLQTATENDMIFSPLTRWTIQKIKPEKV